MWSLFSSTQKWRSIELEESNAAALQITLFNQPWDFSAHHLKQHLLHLPRCYLVQCATPRERRATQREKQSCPYTDVFQPPETKICTSVAFAQVQNQTDPAKANQVTFLKISEVFFELPQLSHSTTKTTTKNTQTEICTWCILHISPVMWPC